MTTVTVIIADNATGMCEEKTKQSKNKEQCLNLRRTGGAIKYFKLKLLC